MWSAWIVFAGLATHVGPVRGQESADGNGHGDSLWAMRTVLEKTLFKVDVLTLQIRFDSVADRELMQAIVGRWYTDQFADSLAAIALRADEAVARIELRRSISLDQFLGGIDEDMRRAVRVGWLQKGDYERIRDALPVWFTFLEARRLQKGDVITYTMHGDTLNTVYRGVEGNVFLNQTDVGRGARESVLGTYLAPGSSFRKGLLTSLFAEPE
jgi:hypothetical protein